VLGQVPRRVVIDGVPVPLACIGDFGGALRALLLAHKERGRSGLGSALGRALAEAVVMALPVSDLPPAGLERVALVPVPSRARAVRTRGDDTVARMAQHAARALMNGGVPAEVAPWLDHARRVRDQAGLRARARRANLAGALIARPPSSWASSAAAVVIVDDVVTTGSTLAEAVRALSAAGVAVSAAATLAATDRRTEVPSAGVERHGLTRQGVRGLVRQADRH
jgi:predicted amidophosphoribosyltransferase